MHLTEYDIASLIDGTMARSQQRTIQSHLATCSHCAAEVAAAVRMINSVKDAAEDFPDPVHLGEAEKLVAKAFRPSLPLRWRFPAAAIILLGIGIWAALELNIPDTPQLRSAAGVRSIPTTSPVDGSTVNTKPIEFRWEAVDGALRYHLHVFSEDGELLKQVESDATSTRIPEDVSLLPGVRYLWKVEALLSDGTRLSSELHVFTFQP